MQDIKDPQRSNETTLVVKGTVYRGLLTNTTQLRLGLPINHEIRIPIEQPLQEIYGEHCTPQCLSGYAASVNTLYLGSCHLCVCFVSWTGMGFLLSRVLTKKRNAWFVVVIYGTSERDI